MTNSLETMKKPMSTGYYDWQKEHHGTSKLAELQKGTPPQLQMTIPDCRKNWDCHEKIGIAKILGLPEEQPEVSEIPNTQLELPKTQNETTKINSNNTGAET